MAGPWRRYPWLTASLLVHALLAAALYAAGPVRVQLKREDGVRAFFASRARIRSAYPTLTKGRHLAQQ